MAHNQNKSQEKLSLRRSVRQNYHTINEHIIPVKSIFISACADIERYIRLKTGCQLREKLEDEAIEKISGLFPYLSGLTADQWNKLISAFIMIRDDNAHLYQDKPIYLDRDILNYLSALAIPEMVAVVNENELTLYGAYYVLTFLSQNFQLWDLSTRLLRADHLSDMSKKSMLKFQVASLTNHKRFVGCGRPIAHGSGRTMLDSTNIDKMLRRELTGLFLEIESCAMTLEYALRYTPSFREMLENIPLIAKDRELFNRLIDLRNIWFHGYWLDDQVMLANGTSKKFDFYETVEMLKMLSEALDESDKFETIVDRINRFGISMLQLKSLRLVEVSYKLMDARLAEKEKLDERIMKMKNAFELLFSLGERYLQASCSLISDGPVSWYINANKFSKYDTMPRETIVDSLKIIRLTSDHGFDIGEYHTDANEIYLCDLYVNERFMLPINGKKLNEYPLMLEKDLCSRIKIYKAEA